MKKKLFVLIGILSILGIFLLLWWNQAGKPTNPTDNNPVIFSIKRGEAVRSVAERLQKQGLIRSPVAFFLLARFGGIADDIQAGDFRLNPAMDLFTITNTLTHGTIDVWITIPEGWRVEEIAHKLAQEMDIPENEFLKVAKEGFMFPDTYLLPKDASAASIANIFMNNFNTKISKDIVDRAQQKGINLEELIIIASLVEREAQFVLDRPIVASVILNRYKIGMKLDIDATIQYALGYQTKDKTWWKKELTEEDLEINSPYNTYKNPGLPPKAIANPGYAAIKAIIEAPSTEYLYYISDKNGKMHFSKTVDEHNYNISRYLK